jgi:hypothetical protein
MFQDGYGFRPAAADWLRFLGWGHYPKGMLRMARTTLAGRRGHQVTATTPAADPALALPATSGGSIGGD